MIILSTALLYVIRTHNREYFIIFNTQNNLNNFAYKVRVHNCPILVILMYLDMYLSKKKKKSNKQ